MSARTYNLHAHPGTGIATQSREIIDESPWVETIIQPREVPPHVTWLAPSAGSTIAIQLYSDVVASRTPSRSRERPAAPLRVPEGEPNCTLVSKLDQPREGPDDFRTNESEVPVEDFNLSMEVGTPNQADSHWTTVHCRCTCCHGSLPDRRPFTVEQVKTFKLATKQMIDEQRQHRKLINFPNMHPSTNTCDAPTFRWTQLWKENALEEKSINIFALCHYMCVCMHLHLSKN